MPNEEEFSSPRLLKGNRAVDVAALTAHEIKTRLEHVNAALARARAPDAFATDKHRDAAIAALTQDADQLSEEIRRRKVAVQPSGESFIAGDGLSGLLIDRSEQTVSFLTEGAWEKVPCARIVACEVRQTAGSEFQVSAASLVTRTIVGGVLAGGLGAVLGASGAKERETSTLDSIDLVTLVTNASKPVFEVNFFRASDSHSPKERAALAERWRDRVLVTIQEARTKAESVGANSHSATPQSPNVVEQLQALIRMKQAGQISDDEFALAKAKVLGSTAR